MSIISSDSNSGWTGRLLHSVNPIHYNLTLRPEIDQTEYTGHVDIKIEIKEATSCITLNADKLKMYNVRLRDESQVEPVYTSTNNITINEKHSTVSFEFQDLIMPSLNIYLSIDFNGTIDTKGSRGMYRSSKTNGNITYSMISTQFESHFARRAFPCFDEPEFKATFDIRLEVDEELTTLSNMDIESKHNINNKKKHVLFKTSPKMSTYTVAFAIGEFEFIEEACWGYQRSKPIPCRIYTLPGDSLLTRFAMNTTINLLAYFEKEFQLPYQLNKLDLIAVPKHNSMAMENWGLITIQENYLFFKEAIHKEAQKSFIVSVVAHELAHQWFGNLVTMKWWSDLWLNEGLAHYFGLIASDFLYPEYEILNQFHDNEFIRLMNSDTSSNLKPIRHSVLDPPEFTSRANNVIYNKGTIIISMLNHTLTKPVFMKNIQGYLQDFQYHTASAEDFYDSMLANSNMDFFSNWFEKPDFPYLNITEQLSLNTNFMTLKIEQLPFNNGVNTLRATLLYIVSDAPGYTTQSILLNTKSVSVTVPRGYAYKIHTGLLSYYRVKYPLSNLLLLKNLKLSSQEILDIISDSFAFYNSKMVSSYYVLPAISLISNMKDFDAMLSAFQLTETYFDHWSNVLTVRVALNELRKEICLSILQLTGRSIEQEVSSKLLLQTKALTYLAHLGDQSIINQAAKEFNNTLSNLNIDSFPHQKVIIQIVLSSSNPYYYQSLLSVLEKSSEKFSDKRNMILYLLPYTCSQHLPAALNWYLKESQNIDIFLLFFHKIPLYPTTLEAIWNFITANWYEFKKTFYNEENLIYTLKRLTSHLVLTQDVQRISNFLANKLSANSFKSLQIMDTSSRYLQDEPGMTETLKKINSNF